LHFKLFLCLKTQFASEDTSKGAKLINQKVCFHTQYNKKRALSNNYFGADVGNKNKSSMEEQKNTNRSSWFPSWGANNQ